MAKLPKKLIKKYGISKKAWSVFRGQHKTKHKATHKVKHGGHSMGKNRGKELLFGLKTNELIGAAGYAVIEPVIDQFTSGIGSNLPIIGQVGDDVVKMGIGLIGQKFVKQPMLKGVFKAMFVINLYKVVKTYTPNILGTATAGSGQNLASF